MASLSVLSNQHYAVIPALQIARDRALDRLRRDQGISYQVNFAHVRLPGGWALEYLAADGAKGAHAQVVSGLLDVLDELAEVGPTESELDLLKTMGTGLRDAPQAVLQALDSAAEREVLGLERKDRQEVWTQLESLKPEQVRAEVADVRDSLLVIASTEIREPDSRLHAVSDWSTTQAIGVEYVPIGQREKGLLVIADESLSWVLDDTHCRTIRWNEVAGVRCWDSGLREVIGPTGMSIFIAPWNWKLGEALPRMIDARVAPGLLIAMETPGTETRRHDTDPERLVQRRWLATLVGVDFEGRSTDIVLRTDGVYFLANQVGANLQDRLIALSAADETELLKTAGGSTRWPIETISEITLNKPGLRRLTKNKPLAVLRIVGIDGRALSVDVPNQDQVNAVKNEFPNVFGGCFQTEL